jgi:hypothetical protein
MGRPRGRGRKPAEAAIDDDGRSAGEETAPTTDKRRGSPPQKTRQDDESEKAEDNAEIEEVADGEKPIVPAESNGEIKRPRRRRRRRQVEEEGKGGNDVRAKRSGLRRNGSRRKNSTPRRAAEAGVQCDRWD